MHTRTETAPEGAVGQRVAIQRKLAGLTQCQLAAAAHVSKSLVNKVEGGAVPASPAFTAAVARALHVDVEALTGEPYGPPLTHPSAEHAGIPELRVALGRDADPELDGPPMTAAELRVRLDECQAQRERSRYSTVVTALPELLNHAYAIVADARSGSGAEQAWALLDDAYELASTVTLRFGYYDLGSLVARCGRDASARSGDPLRAAVATFRYHAVQLRQGDHTGVLRASDRGHALLNGRQSPTADAIRTVLHLRQATAQVQLPADAQPSRVGHHWVDVARAWTLHGDRAKALDSLKQARRISPQQTRYHPSVHETVRILAERDRRATDTLAGFARWIGVTL